MRQTTLVILLFSTLVSAQDLRTTLNEVISTNPIILERLKNYNSTKEDIQSAKSGYYPKLDISLGAGYEHSKREDFAGNTTLNKRGNTVNKLGLGVYQNALTYTQNIFNGFATTYKVKQQKHRTISAAYSYIETVNDTSFDMVNNYLQVMKNEELLQNAKANVDINDEILTKVQKLYDSGLTTLSEVNKIESSLSLARSNYIVQENTLLDVTYNMKRVLGRFLDIKKMIQPTLDIELPESLEKASQFAIEHNPSLLVSSYNIKLAQATFKEKIAPYYPSLDVEISQSLNKNLSAVEGTDDRFRAMAYLKYNIFNGFADSSALQQSKSRIHQEVESKNDLRRQVLEGLELSWAANEKLTEQLKYLEEYKKFSLKTLTLYSKEYDLGRRSLLDLLSAQNDFIGAKSQIINTTYSMLFAKYRILDALGILVPSLIENNENIYSNVGLNVKTPENTDTLPIRLDKDNDLIANDKDICTNSLSNEMKDIYGCKATFVNIQQIERYSGFFFTDEVQLSDEGQDNFTMLVKQIKDYGFENLHFDIIGHVDEDLDEESMLKISYQRASHIQKMLVEVGAKEEYITIHPQSNKAPLYTNETIKGKVFNNRVDIVVKKLNK